jgi:hypothetical protein
VFTAKRAGAKEIVEVKTGSHAVMISHPDEVAQLIEHASQSTWKQTAAAQSPSLPELPIAASRPTAETFAPAPVVSLPSQAPARLVVDAPLPEQLATGYVVIRYRAENVRILPVYGPAAQDSDRVGKPDAPRDRQPVDSV